MFTDYWVIAQLLAQGCALALLLYASVFGMRSLRFWAVDSDTTLQLELERQNYLMGAIMQVGLWFQALSLLMFLHTVNDHLPPLLKGAMCATGTLGINAWGYPLLFLKSASILIYAIYLFINYLDNQEPAYPLTPHKYSWLYPALLLSVLDLYVLVQYFAHIKPDLIATCCSVDFSAHEESPYNLLNRGTYLQIGIAFWAISFIFLWVGNAWKVFQRNVWVAWSGFALSGLYVLASIYSLKYFFVKYIYGLPSHLCLFDIFWGKYYGIGYVLFGAYYAVLLGMLGNIIVRFYIHKLTHDLTAFQAKLRLLVWVGLCTSFVLPCLYWLLSSYSL